MENYDQEQLSKGNVTLVGTDSQCVAEDQPQIPFTYTTTQGLKEDIDED